MGLHRIYKWILILLLVSSSPAVAQRAQANGWRHATASCTDIPITALADADRTNMTFSSGEWCPTTPGNTGQIQANLYLVSGDSGHIITTYGTAAENDRMVIGLAYDIDLPGQTEATDYFFGMDYGIYVETNYKVHDNTNGFQDTGVAAVEGDLYGIFITTGGVATAKYYRSGAWHDLAPTNPFPAVSGSLYVYGAGAVADHCFLNFIGCGLTEWAP